MRRVFVTRFAPSPTGYLHLGHAFSALTAYAAAQAAGGRFLLRIEDLDQGRSRPDFEAAIYEDLAWLGLSWAEPPRRQSAHLDDYARALDRLIAQGVAYRCFRTRREVLAAIADAPHGPKPLYFGQALPAAEEAARLGAGQAFAWRLSSARVRDALGARLADLRFSTERGETPLDPARLGDAVIARKDFPASYHLASVVDDALQGVSDVIRGEDLADSAHLHVVLQTLLDLPTPRYRHHRLIHGPDGVRLAKRDSATALRALRAEGLSPEDVRAHLGFQAAKPG